VVVSEGRGGRLHPMMLVLCASAEKQLYAESLVGSRQCLANTTSRRDCFGRAVVTVLKVQNTNGRVVSWEAMKPRSFVGADCEQL
jgi:hypothetical protein